MCQRFESILIILSFLVETCKVGPKFKTKKTHPYSQAILHLFDKQNFLLCHLHYQEIGRVQGPSQEELYMEWVKNECEHHTYTTHYTH